MADSAALELNGVQKSFGKIRVLRDVTLNVGAGEIALVVGPNGAGKSTLLRVCVSLARPDSGTVEFGGSRHVPLGEIGYTTHEPMIYGALTLRENIDLIARIRDVPGMASEAIASWELQEFAERRVSELSKGLQGRAALCRAFLGRPRYLFLDEPSSSLDDAASKLLCAKIKEFIHSSNGCVLLVTHDITRFSEIANRVVVLREGQVWRDSGSAGKANEKNAVLSSFLEINR